MYTSEQVEHLILITKLSAYSSVTTHPILKGEQLKAKDVMGELTKFTTLTRTQALYSCAMMP